MNPQNAFLRRPASPNTGCARRNASLWVRWFGFLCAASSSALAQTGKTDAQATAPPVGPFAPPVATAAVAPTPPLMPMVTDAMLAPPPRPARILANWSEALVELRARSVDLATSLAEVRRAEAQSRIALAALLPSINGTATATHQLITKTGYNSITGTTTITPSTDYINGGVTLSQSLVDTKAWHDLGTARASEVVQRLGVESTRRTMVLSLATAIVAVITAERVAEVNRIALRSALELLELTNRKRLLGAATGLDTVRAEQAVVNVRSTLVSGDESLRQSRESLGLALGESQQVAVGGDFKLDGIVDVVGQNCRPLNSPADRPEMAASRQQLVVAERGIRSVELSFLPTLKAQSSVASSTLSSGTAPRTTWNIQAVLTVPIWDGGARYGSLRVARVGRDEAAYSLESSRRSINVEVEQARRGVQVAEQSLAVARTAVDLATRNDELTRTAYRLGQGTTSFELVAAAQALQQAQIQLAVKEFGVVGARLSALLTMANCSE